jgi:NAD(P)-dependent dehydrogenase (short-subunit alcohol dehydrogenase family)
LESKKRAVAANPKWHLSERRTEDRSQIVNALKDKVAIVTGASSGIGNAAAKLFAQEGAKVVLAGRRKAELDALVGEIEKAGGNAIAVTGDVRNEVHAKALVDTAIGRFGGLDVAFNNAGSSGEMAPVPEMSLPGWHDTIETNLTSAFLGAKYQVPAMIKRGGGSIVFTSSFVGNTVGFPGAGAYAAAKAGIVGLMQVLAVEFGAKGIRVNAILPGGTDTPANHANLPNAPEGTRAFIEGLHALKRLARPDEIARSALHLASDASSFISGIALLVDGGVSINRT